MKVYEPGPRPPSPHHRPRPKSLRHPQRPREVKDGFTVKLSPASIIKGRILDADGQPLENITITEPGIILSSPAMMGPPKPAPTTAAFSPLMSTPRKFQTDKDGRFELRGIIPGLKYTADCEGPAKIGGQTTRCILGNLFTDVTTQPGETKDLGDLKITSDKRQQPKAQGKVDKSKLLARRASEGKPASTTPAPSATEKSPLPSGRGPG